MPYLNSKKVYIDSTNNIIQIYDSYTNYAVFNLNSIIGCSVLSSKAKNPNIFVELCYFEKDYYDNFKLSVIKLEYKSYELKKNTNQIQSTDWIKKALTKDKRNSEFMIIDNNKLVKNDIEVLNKKFNFNKIIYTNLLSLKKAKNKPDILDKLPKTVFVIGNVLDYNKVVNILGTENTSYGFTTKKKFITSLGNYFKGTHQKINFIKAHHENNDFIILNNVGYGIFADRYRLNSLFEDFIQPKKLSYSLYSVHNEDTAVDRLIDSKGFKITIENDHLLLNIPKSNSNKIGLLFPSVNNGNNFTYRKATSVTVICESDGYFSADNDINTSDITRFKISENKLIVY